MDKRLRLLLVSTALLFAPLIGQFITSTDLRTTGHPSDLAVLFAVVGIFTIPTTLILTTAVLFILRRHWRQHPLFFLLGALNLLLSLTLAWRFIHPV